MKKLALIPVVAALVYGGLRLTSHHHHALHDVRDRVWIDHMPRGERDTINVFAVLTRQPVGVFQAASAWKGAYEAFRYEKHGNEIRYDRYGRYVEPRRIHRGDNIWRGRDGRYYCRRDNGTTGLIIGAAGGALVGRAVDTRGERTTGTVVGAALGALLGREIDRGEVRCR